MTGAFSWSLETAAKRTEEAFARLRREPDAFRSVFVRLFEDEARETAAKLSPDSASPLGGALVSIKDLYDVKGYVTTAGSRVLAEEPPAARDAALVARVRAAGAVMLGHTNMTEFAYSGLGLNPHYGTPDNPARPGHIPGGSTSGGAVSVALGLADIAFGSDTGGSLRIPAAFTGIVGFKPSQASVSRRGVAPLSQSLDSVGPIARSVQACHAAWSLAAGRSFEPLESAATPQLKAAIPTNFGLDGLDPAVERGFERAVAALSKANWDIEERRFEVLEEYKTLPVWQFAAVESYAFWGRYCEEKPELFDPRVIGRMRRAFEVSSVDYRRTLNRRADLIEAFAEELGESSLLLPTVAIAPPSFEAVASDEDYTRLNLMALRNCSLANVMDGCSISLPMKEAGTPVGVMLTKRGGLDLRLLSQAEAAFRVLREA